jgi:hypothetical protein
MRILQLIQHTNILQLDIQELVHALERTPDRDVILEFDRHFVVNEGFEETVCATSISYCLLGLESERLCEGST